MMGNKALKSGIWYTVANFVMKSITFITTPIFARMLTHTEYGLFSNFTSWMSTLIVIVTLNLESTFITARFEHEERFDEYVFSTLALSSLSGIAWFVLALLFPNQVRAFTKIEPVHIYLLMIYLIALPAVQMFQARERFFFRYKTSVFISLAVAFSNAILSIILVCYMKDRLTGRIIGSVAPVILIGAVLSILIVMKGKHIDIAFWKYALPICLPFIPHLLSLSLLNSLDRMMITRYCGAEENALYTIAYTCGAIVTLLTTSMNSAFAPWLGEKLNAGENDEIRTTSQKYILLFVVFAVGLMLATPEVLVVMGGRSYREALYVMPPVAFGCVCQFLYTMYVNIEQFKKKTVSMAIASLSAALLNYILNYILIPRFGYIAAAYTTLISFIWLLFAHMIIVNRIGYSNIYSTKLVVLVVLGMSVCTATVNILYSHDVIRFGVVLVYFGFLWKILMNNKAFVLGIFKRG